MTRSFFLECFSRGLRFYEGLEKTVLKLEENLKKFTEKRKKEMDKAKIAKGMLIRFE